MNQEQVWRELSALPPAAQQLVVDFIRYLHDRYAQDSKIEQTDGTSLSSEPFIGMWQDRTDMTNSNEWVRDLRTKEWGPLRG